MRELIAKVYKPGAREHSGTAWMASANQALTAWHCLEQEDGTPFPVGALYRLRFESGEEVESIVCGFNRDVDVALLEILNRRFATRGKIVFGKLPRGDAWRHYCMHQAPGWECYGYPSGYTLGLTVDGVISGTDANVETAFGKPEKALQLRCEHGGHGNLDGLSGGAVIHKHSIVGIIRSGPPGFAGNVIHAVSIERIAEVFPAVRKIVAQSFADAVTIVAPNLLGSQEKKALPSMDEDRRACKTRTNLPRKKVFAHGRDGNRTAICARILDEMARTSLITISGADGIGKKTLALHVASELLERVEALFLVDLFPIQKERATAAIANELGVKEAHDHLLLDNVIAEIGDKRVLLVILSADALANHQLTLDRLLDGCKNLRVIAVVNQKYGWAFEHNHELGPLQLPDDFSDADLELLEGTPLIQLFSESLLANNPNFTMTPANAGFIRALCASLYGSRLAISLVGALASDILTNKPSQYEEFADLSNFLKNLKGLPIQKQHRGLIEKVFLSLDSDTQGLLCRLAVFKGGCTDNAAIEIDRTSVPSIFSTRKKLEILTRKGLLFSYAHVGQVTRHGMPVEVRNFCLERMSDSERYSAYKDHADYYWRIVNQIERRITLIGGTDIPQALETLDSEYSNVIEAYRWLRDSSDNTRREMGLSIIGNLFWFWNLRGSLHEGRTLAEDMLKKHPWKKGEALGAALYCAGGLAFLQGDFSNARSYLTRSIAVLESTGNERRLAYALVVLGMVALHHNEIDEALWHEERAVQLFEQTDNSVGLALANNDLANVLLQKAGSEDVQGINEAEKMFLSTYKLWKDLNNAWGIGLTSGNLGYLNCRKKDYALAERWLMEAMSIQKTGRYQWGYAESIKRMGYVALAKGDYCSAASLFFDSLALHRRLGRLQLVADCVEGLAKVGIKSGELEAVPRLLGAAEGIRERIGVKLTVFEQEMHLRAKRRGVEKWVGDHRPEPDFHCIFDEGKKLDMVEASKQAATFAQGMLARKKEPA